MSFEKVLTEDRRLVLLRILNDMTGYRANSSVLAMAMAHFGHTLTRDYIRTQLAWLAEQDLVKIDDIGPVIIATLTERGQEVAKGLAIAPGVSRPGA